MASKIEGFGLMLSTFGRGTHLWLGPFFKARRPGFHAEQHTHDIPSADQEVVDDEDGRKGDDHDDCPFEGIW